MYNFVCATQSISYTFSVQFWLCFFHCDPHNNAYIASPLEQRCPVILKMLFIWMVLCKECNDPAKPYTLAQFPLLQFALHMERPMWIVPCTAIFEMTFVIFTLLKMYWALFKAVVCSHRRGQNGMFCKFLNALCKLPPLLHHQGHSCS